MRLTLEFDEFRSFIKNASIDSFKFNDNDFIFELNSNPNILPEEQLEIVKKYYSATNFKAKLHEFNIPQLSKFCSGKIKGVNYATIHQLIPGQVKKVIVKKSCDKCNASPLAFLLPERTLFKDRNSIDLNLTCLNCGHVNDTCCECQVCSNEKIKNYEELIILNEQATSLLFEHYQKFITHQSTKIIQSNSAFSNTLDLIKLLLEVRNEKYTKKQNPLCFQSSYLLKKAFDLQIVEFRDLTFNEFKNSHERSFFPYPQNEINDFLKRINTSDLQYFPNGFSRYICFNKNICKQAYDFIDTQKNSKSIFWNDDLINFATEVARRNYIDISDMSQETNDNIINLKEKFGGIEALSIIKACINGADKFSKTKKMSRAQARSLVISFLNTAHERYDYDGSCKNYNLITEWELSEDWNIVSEQSLFKKNHSDLLKFKNEEQFLDFFGM